jgi:8-oxo-dGTP pyrophosphatase MutT (NUDIX family)
LRSREGPPAPGYRLRDKLRDNGPVPDSELPDAELSDAELPDAGLPVRVAGRVIAIDPAGRVLLFGYDDPPPRGQHWSTPGGGVEEGEDFYTAARRELFEETGWTDVPVSPVEVHTVSSVYYSELFHGLVSQTDHFFVGQVPDEERPLGEVAAMHAADGITRHRWWSLEDLDASAENVYPRGLTSLVRGLRHN